MIVRLDEKLIGYPGGYHFAVLETPSTDPVDGTVHIKRQIVIKNGDNITVEGGVTNLASYVHPYDKKWTRAKAPTQQELLNVCEALNFFGRNGVRQFSDISKEMVEMFFDYYRDKPVNGNREHFVGSATLALCVKTVVYFLGNLYKDHIISIDPESIMSCSRPLPPKAMVSGPKSSTTEWLYWTFVMITTGGIFFTGHLTAVLLHHPFLERF